MQRMLLLYKYIKPVALSMRVLVLEVVAVFDLMLSLEELGWCPSLDLLQPVLPSVC